MKLVSLVLELGWVDAPIGGGIVEVVIEGMADVGIMFDDCRPQVFVALDDHEVMLLAEPEAAVAASVLSSNHRNS